MRNSQGDVTVTEISDKMQPTVGEENTTKLVNATNYLVHYMPLMNKSVCTSGFCMRPVVLCCVVIMPENCAQLKVAGTLSSILQDLRFLLHSLILLICRNLLFFHIKLVAILPRQFLTDYRN